MKSLIAWILSFATFAYAAPQKPNILIILSDDMGYSDIGSYGGEIDTPNLDSLAKGGLRLTQFYNTARCCPSRASLLTGLYPHQAGIGHMMNDRGKDGYRGELRQDTPTIAEALKPAGYRSYMIGKWHVTQQTAAPKAGTTPSNWPLQRGFDRFYGTIHGAGSFFDPNTLTRDNRYISPFTDPEYSGKDYYYTDALSDQAARFISEHAKTSSDSPFFMYLAYTAAHWPLHAKEKDISKYRGRFDAGYAALRQARIEKMKKLGLLKNDATIAPQNGGSWSDVPNLEFELRCMEVYAAMIDSMDQGIGRIIDQLKQSGQFENTLIFFLQDNGGCAEPIGRRRDKDPSSPQARPGKPSLPPLAEEYLQPDMIPKQTRNGFPMRQGYGVLPGAADTYLGYGEAWANVSNTPFREYKHWVHEGGISTPLIAHWPRGTKPGLANQLEPTPGHLIDLMATCLDVAGIEIKKDQFTRKPEGISLKPLLQGESIERGKPIFWEHEGNRAVREGPWKLVAKDPAGAWELYNIEQDRAEQQNLANSEPERVNTMIKQWETWAHNTHVLPWIWKPAYGEPATTKATPKGKAKKDKRAKTEP
ncbi:arylsulfatase [Phragmitibacter flavus]|uniref:Arylsulfatase n=1 Tax=Phragmitibacter flavus TaxID=2576071 RepID=A0A5R8KAA2_9BACT|nr:arylsulfatase [Phragmitibacter flavus]TLD69236.1 arylsulfatase [Phragmitibacter flavus]